MSELLIDLVRVAHLLAFAVGFGAAIFIEATCMPRALRGFRPGDLDQLFAAHKIISWAVAALWASGLLLIAIRTGGDPSALTPKLVMKLAIVSLLSVNMALISSIALPDVAMSGPLGLRTLSPGRIARLGAIAGLSAGCWLMALALGGIGGFKTLDAPTLLALFLPALAAALVIGTVAALVATGKLGRGRAARVAAKI